MKKIIFAAMVIAILATAGCSTKEVVEEPVTPVMVERG